MSKIGYIHSLQSLGTVDGPGVRAVVFAAGCPLRCGYCHNPDTWNMADGKRTDAGELAAHGIHMEKDGSLTMDRDTVYTCAKDGSLENFFSKEHSFSSDLLKKLSDISLNPMEYLDKTVVTYPNTAAKKTYNPYVTSIYSGLLFNNYC